MTLCNTKKVAYGMELCDAKAADCTCSAVLPAARLVGVELKPGWKLARASINSFTDQSGQEHTLAEIDGRLCAMEGNDGHSQLTVDNWEFVRFHKNASQHAAVRYRVTVREPWGTSMAQGDTVAEAFLDVSVPALGLASPSGDQKNETDDHKADQMAVDLPAARPSADNQSTTIQALVTILAGEHAPSFFGTKGTAWLPETKMRGVDRGFAAWPKRYPTPSGVQFLSAIDDDDLPQIRFYWRSGCDRFSHDRSISFYVHFGDDASDGVDLDLVRDEEAIWSEDENDEDEDARPDGPSTLVIPSEPFQPSSSELSYEGFLAEAVPYYFGQWLIDNDRVLAPGRDHEGAVTREHNYDLTASQLRVLDHMLHCDDERRTVPSHARWVRCEDNEEDDLSGPHGTLELCYHGVGCCRRRAGNYNIGVSMCYDDCGMHSYAVEHDD